MNKLFLHIIVMGLFCVFILLFGIIGFLRTKQTIFLYLIIVYFLMFFSTVILFNLGKIFFKKIKKIFPGIGYLFLFFEIFYFIILICVKLFFKATTNTGIYHSDFFVFILLGCIISCHYGWYFFKKHSWLREGGNAGISDTNFEERR